jgi:predicted negative regulator of RcsB-dependent stress response
MNASPRRLRDEDSKLGQRLREFGDAPGAPASARSLVLSRVEAKVSRRVVSWRALAAVAVGSVAVAVLVLRPSVTRAPASVVFASRDALLLEPGNPHPVAAATWGTRRFEAVTTADGPVVLEENGTRLALMPHARVDRGEGNAVRLQQGTLAASVAHETVFETGGRQVRVRRGVVVLQGSCVVVRAGDAELARDGVTVTMTTGERSPPECTTEDGERLLELFDAPLASLHVDASGPVVVDGVPLGAGALDVRLKAGSHTIAAAGVERRVELDPTSTSTSLTIPTAATALEDARRDSKTDPDRALAGLASIVEGPNAEVALYERALLLQRTNALGPALQALEEHQRRFPQGMLAVEAALTRAEVLLSLERTTDALLALDTFLSTFPESERRSEVHLLRGQLLRQAQRCDAALADFTEAAREARWADEASWGEVLCRRTAESLSRYLRAFPRGAHADEARRLRGSEKF